MSDCSSKAELAEAGDASRLPDTASAGAALHELVVRTRLSAGASEKLAPAEA
ncbi:hypothetical protein GCM10010517_34190 [Streptosporangium fragile]|uniref:Uncharacterized protein n=1 Tax=Streptosporangium fragile TaxID=46186 RepID=A0ABN3VXI9_9ACTN